MMTFLRNTFIGLSLVAVTTINAQQNPITQRTCATPVPSAQWDAWFNQQVEEFVATYGNGKKAMPTYQIPVVFHVIHGGQPIGTYPNLDSNQVKSQVPVLNNDFNGTGQNVGNCPPAFQPVIASSGISFCLAVKDPTNGVMPEKGINRVNFSTFTLSSAFSSKDPAMNGAGFTNFINQIVKPQTIWDPTKYLNIWVTDQPANGGLLGFATFPAGTTLPGIPGGGIATTDGCWLWAKATGSVGILDPTYNLGRTATHEIGHWLGLRHVWGDGNCVSDFCNDIPPAEAAHYGCPAAPHHTNVCGAGQSPNGEQTMNFMDYTDDVCMYMFSNDQKTRMLTAMSQGTFRNLLGTHGLCNTGPPPPPSPPVANFSFVTSPCSGQPLNLSNGSTGGPPPTFSWSASSPAPTVSFTPNATVASPAVTFSVPGTYTLTLVATNTTASSSFSVVVTVTPCPKEPVCLDTLRAIKKVDSLITYVAPASSQIITCGPNINRGWLTGMSCYKDKEKAQYFSAGTYSDTPVPQINSLIVLFDTIGTKGAAGTQVKVKIWGHSPVTGAPTASLIASKSDSLNRITNPAITTATNSLSWIGSPTYVLPSNRIKAYRFNFNPPTMLPTNGFYASVEMPITQGDSLLIFSSTYANAANDSSAWVMEFLNNNWKSIKNKYGVRVKLGIIPIITCLPKVGVNENTLLASSINVMPNPSEGIFNIVTSFEQSKNITIQVHNYLGQVIETVKYDSVTTNVFTSDLSSRANGIYFLTISSNGEKVTKKLIVSR